MKTLLPSLAASVVACIWGFVSWAVMSWHMPLAFKDSAAVAAVLKANAPVHGMYQLPLEGGGDMTPENMEKQSAAWNTGPVFYGSVRPGAGEFNMGKSMLLSWAKGLTIIMLASFVLRRLASQSFSSRLVVCMVIYSIGGMYGSLPLAIWYDSPWYHTLKLVADSVIEGTLVGCILAKWSR
jgi:hypothetical protein